jgi:hypothetical protein
LISGIIIRILVGCIGVRTPVLVGSLIRGFRACYGLILK